MKRIPFTKMHGCGNDYIYVNAMQHPITEPQATAIAWSDRHKGIGSDGLVLIDRSPVPEADYAMRIFNADGSEAMMCGNASRCIGKYLYEKALTGKTEIRLLTLSGIKTLQLHLADGKVESVTVDMGEPVLKDESLFVGSRCAGKGTFVSMGNPHYVIFTDNVDQVGETGRILEHYPAFPQRCNIEFAAPLSSLAAPLSSPEGKAPLSSPEGDTMDTRAEEALCQDLDKLCKDAEKAVDDGFNYIILTDKTNVAPSGAEGGAFPSGAFRVRVWERGSGITQACGTGACATAVAACLTERAGRTSNIVMDGGTLHIEWRESDNHVYMTGPAAFVFDGEAYAP